ncbi:hypothetical protein [Clostridium sp. ZBS2]|uniref:hypothetical protein n=1 Tax=Clostridium sp. ZBS2 TaxID=2949976 RepID=UPI00207AA122|nr:hypothetical protein [Clostridium sp. ZBS2]
MELIEYKNCLYKTLQEIYPIYFKKKILRKMSEDGAIINDKRKNLNGQISMMINVSDIESIDDKLRYILKNSENEFCKGIYKYIEEFEYEKEYRNTSFFKIDGYSTNRLEKLIESGLVKRYIKNCNIYDDINDKFINPTIKETQDDLYIKFNHSLKNRHAEEIKYVIMAIIHIKEKILEIRLDRVGAEYKNPNNDFYATMIDNTKKVVSKLFSINIINIDFKAVVNYMKDEKDEVYIYAQKMTRNGSVAYLEAVNNKETINNEDLVIPILGELKSFIKDNSELLNKTNDTQQIKLKLQNLIEEIEITSDLPKVKITWINENIRVGIDHEYKGREYSFFMYYDELNEGKERMNHVREYLINCHRELENQT